MSTIHSFFYDYSTIPHDQDADTGSLTIDLMTYANWMPEFYECHQRSSLADYINDLVEAELWTNFCEHCEGQVGLPSGAHDDRVDAIIRESFNRVYRLGCEIIRKSIVATYLTMRSLGYNRDVGRLIARAAWATRNEKCWLSVVMK